MRKQIKFRAGLVGAGEICAHHVDALRRLPRVEIVGLFDSDPARTQAASARLGVRQFPSLEALRHAGADVIHVLTPTSAHAGAVLTALDVGCHVYVEKPAAVDVADCRAMENLARARGLQVCVGHSRLYDPCIVKTLAIAKGGSLGRIVAIDYLCSALYPPYSGGPLPAAYRSAGYPFRDVGVDALYLFEAFLGPIEHVQADWKSIGGAPNLAFDEWRAQVRCRDGMAQCQLSWNVRPVRAQLIIQGTKGVHRATISTNRKRRNVGVHSLVAEFYSALASNASAPVPIADAKRIVQWTERVARLADQDHHRRVATLRLSSRVPALVTGASGALGRAVVARLRDEGKEVRIFVRRPPELAVDGIEVAIGDLGDPEAVDRAVRGAEIVIHAGAARNGSAAEFQCATITGTENIVNACLEHGVKKLVHISSLSVLDHLRASRAGSVLDESCGYEPHPKSRDVHARSKLEAEQCVATAVRQRNLRAIILRPGQMFGGSIPLLTPAVARQFASRWIVLGDGKRPLPLIHVEDVVDAIFRTMDSDVCGGEIVHLLDDAAPTENEVLQIVLGPDARVVHLPKWLALAGRAIASVASGCIGRGASTSIYQMRAAMSSCQFTSINREILGNWRPTISVRDSTHHGIAPVPSLARKILRSASPGSAKEMLAGDELKLHA